MPKSYDFKKDLDKLAKKIAEEAISTQSPHDRMDAFKILTNYYAATTKLTPKETPATLASEDTFDGFRQQVETSGRGSDPAAGKPAGNA